MKLPDGLLKKQFVHRMVRGTILRFEFSDWNDPSKTNPGPKFAIVLNRPGLDDPIYLALTTSNVATYNATKRFDAVVVKIRAHEYDCFELDTAIPFRSDPVIHPRAKLERQILDGKLLFVGTLNATHLAEIDRIVAQGTYISAGIAAKAAAARWGKLPRATHRGNFQDDFGIDVDCYVLDDEQKTAVVSQRGMAAAIGLAERGNAFIRFAKSKSIARHGGAELLEKIANPLVFTWGTGGAQQPPTPEAT